MNQVLPPPPQNAPDAPAPPLPGPGASADEFMTAYVGLLAGWFDIGQLAAGRRLNRAGVRTHLLSDA